MAGELKANPSRSLPQPDRRLHGFGNRARRTRQSARRFCFSNDCHREQVELEPNTERWAAEHARWQLEAQRRRVLNSVRTRYFEALGAQRNVEIAMELQEVAQAGVSTTRQRFEAQQASQPDVLQAEIYELPSQPLSGRLEDNLQATEYESLWH